MTKEELKAAFDAECTASDQDGKRFVKGTPAEIVDWIAAKFCQTSENSHACLFSKAFTGMADKHGTPIHEGDTIRLYYKGEYVKCQVVYDSKHAAFLIKWSDGYVNQYLMNGGNYEVVRAAESE